MARLFHLESHHPELLSIYERLPAYGHSESAVLIGGESGTGKEVIAQLLHENSERRLNPFIAVNCAAIPETLFEAELFGVEKGAATGTLERKGKFELADRGTLFLDEIGELPLSVQAKLLRVLQERKVARVGSSEDPKSVDFRILSATNKNLAQMVADGTFREDLYYRVNVVQIDLPPLRERAQDVGVLAKKLLKKICSEKIHLQIEKKLSESAVSSLEEYSWPGNIRELHNKLESAIIHSGDSELIEPQHLRLVSVHKVDTQNEDLQEFGLNLREAKNKLERKLISIALKRSNGNKAKAARILGVSREGLRKAILRAS